MSTSIQAQIKNPRRRACPAVPVTRDGRSNVIDLNLLLIVALCICGSLAAHATVTLVTVQSPKLSTRSTVAVTTPVHFAATAESDLEITGYVVYVDHTNVYRNFSPSLDAWIILPPGGTHSVYITAWDSSGSHLSTATYAINVTGASPPTPPNLATRMADIDNPAFSYWTVDNNNGVGGQCNHGSIGAFDQGADPNTMNSPDFDGKGQHFIVKSQCTYDDSLFYWKDPADPQSDHANFLWDFWFYIPTTTRSSTVQALEFDFFQAVPLSDGVHEFMFGSQCNYVSNQWQIWLPHDGGLTWVNAGLSPCQFSTGTWHHLTYFLQRVTASGYQEIPRQFDPTTDTNTSVRFGTLSIDGVTYYLGGLSYSTIPHPEWGATIGLQHQLDSSASGVTIEEFVDEESVATW
jgi:hypothetical protein